MTLSAFTNCKLQKKIKAQRIVFSLLTQSPPILTIFHRRTYFKLQTNFFFSEEGGSHGREIEFVESKGILHSVYYSC